MQTYRATLKLDNGTKISGDVAANSFAEATRDAIALASLPQSLRIVSIKVRKT